MKFYSIDTSDINDDSLCFTVGLNPGHPLFAGHFPGQPVVPGVLLVQMVRELLTQGLGQDYRLTAASSVKFLNAVDPNHVDQLRVNIDISRFDEDVLSINAIATHQEVTYCKLRAKFE